MAAYIVNPETSFSYLHLENGEVAKTIPLFHEG